jgi:hypothetical protein
MSNQVEEADDASCVLALSYSNVPQIIKENPVIVVGLLTTKNLVDQLENVDFDEKERVIRRKNSILNLEQISEDLAEYILDYRVKVTESIREPINEVKQIYDNIIRELIGGTLYAFQKSIVYARKIIDYGFEEKEIAPDFPTNARIIYCSKGTSNKFFKLSRLLARLHYEKERTVNSSTVLERVKQTLPNNFQIVRFRWNSPQVENYNGLNVGPPFLVVKKPFSRHLETYSILIGKRFDISPIARFCRGQDNDGEITNCIHSHGSENPYGSILIDSLRETCQDCSQIAPYLECTYRRPACDGMSVACKNYAFAGVFCLGPHSLYVTHFGNTLKVGTAFGNNVIGRLLEQGAASALIISPINGVKLASDLELAVTRNLKENYIKQIKSNQEISKAVFRGPSNERRLDSFLKSWDQSRIELLEGIRKHLFSSLIEFREGHIKLNKANTDSWIVSLMDCYEYPGNLTRFEKYSKSVRKRSRFCQGFSGKVVGYRGPFIFFDDGNILDLKALQGFVVEGNVDD